MNRWLSRRPSPAMAVAFIALLAALSGTAVALPGKNTVDSGDIKKGAVKTSDIAKNSIRGANVGEGSLSGADVKDDSLTGADVQESSLGTVPSANTANSATTANTANTANAAATANTANSATTATTATTANSANNLGGAPASEYQRRTAQSGQTLSGQLAEVHNPGAVFWLAGSSYPVPLPAGTPAPTLEYRSDGSPSATCPGVGQATSGRLCVYGYNTINVSSVSLSLNDENRRYGFSLDITPADVDGDGYMLANWAYQVP
jgi:hypothetical protein